MTKRNWWLALAGGCALLAGCASPDGLDETPPAVVAKYIDRPLRIDAGMSDPAWLKAPEYRMIGAEDIDSLPPKMAEAVKKTAYLTDVRVKMLYDQDHLYVGFRIVNDDIRAAKPQDQALLYSYGDCMEIFLKPLNANGYFELYANASGNRSSFFFPSRAFLYGSFQEKAPPIPDLLEVYSSVDGTLNDASDLDRGWTTVMVINRKVLAERTGVPFDGAQPWTVLFAGYAYSSHKIYCSRFSYPKLPRLDFHCSEYYARLVLDSPAAAKTAE